MPRRAFLALGAALAAWTVSAVWTVWAAWAAGPEAQPEPRATFLGSYAWSRDESAFGGFSAIEMAEDGAGFFALSDRGTLFVGRFARSAGGAISSAEEVQLFPIRDSDGAPVERRLADSEGLALDGDGGFHVSFENIHRVWHYSAPGAAAEPLPPSEDFRALGLNTGLEALAADAAGRLYLLPESEGGPEEPIPLWRWDGQAWEMPFGLARLGDFVATGADFGPDGLFYLLERDVGFLSGFRSRVSRFDLGADGLGPRQVLFETEGREHGNLEGLAVWRDEFGAIRLTMISDNDFLFFRRTEIVDYRVEP